MESQALRPEGILRPRKAAKATNNKPAGISLNEDTKKGPVLGKTSFIATIAVPQKKNGDINNPHSHTPPINLNTGSDSISTSTFSPLSLSLLSFSSSNFKSDGKSTCGSESETALGMELGDLVAVELR